MCYCPRSTRRHGHIRRAGGVEVLAATFGWINDRYVRLPLTVGIMAMGLALSLALVALSLVYPPIKVDAQRFLAFIDFDQLLLVFSVMVQGLSMKPLVKLYVGAAGTKG